MLPPCHNYLGTIAIQSNNNNNMNSASKVNIKAIVDDFNQFLDISCFKFLSQIMCDAELDPVKKISNETSDFVNSRIRLKVFS